MGRHSGFPAPTMVEETICELSLIPAVSMASNAIDIDSLARTFVLPIRPRVRGNYRSQDQPYTRIDMLGILFGVSEG